MRFDSSADKERQEIAFSSIVYIELKMKRLLRRTTKEKILASWFWFFWRLPLPSVSNNNKCILRSSTHMGSPQIQIPYVQLLTEALILNYRKVKTLIEYTLTRVHAIQKKIKDERLSCTLCSGHCNNTEVPWDLTNKFQSIWVEFKSFKVFWNTEKLKWTCFRWGFYKLSRFNVCLSLNIRLCMKF